ncbi:pirin family protein [Lysobacter sp. LF1]|uniref:Pirin family protein n=1 Tax=Lysobacter stagni TaxID=3045172 RepID=A0ABT6XCE0_9GAMM|nr:pirin family protein [Lysobacter sp. LF1]MDI9237588.1 pirin family protein [Lysobacter sp. LF1]
MILQRPSDARGRSGHDSRQTFSFGGHYDAAWMGFGPLRVLNERHIAPGAALDVQRRANMEILAYVVDGALAHHDGVGGDSVVGAGELQWLSAGHGVQHAQANASADTPAHVLEIWIQPSRLNHEPAAARRGAVPDDVRGWVLLASGDGRDDSLAIRQDIGLSQARLARGEEVHHPLDPSRLYWLHLVRGEATVNGAMTLQAGDALGLRDESGVLALQGGSDKPALALLFDLPR